MTPELRATTAAGRLASYHSIMRTVFFANVGVVAVIQIGPDGYSAPLTMMAISVAVYGILAGGASLDDLIALRQDMDDETAASNYGKTLKARNTGMLKNISAALLGLTGIAELFAIWT